MAHESKSYEERHESAAETFRNFSPGADPEAVARNFAERLGPLGSMAFDVVGAMWSRPQLNRRDRSLLVISTLAAQARENELVAHTRNGLQHGLTTEEVEEIVLHVAAYAGYPAAMASSRRIDTALREWLKVENLPVRKAAVRKSDAERDRDAAEVLARLGGGLTSPMHSAEGEVGVISSRWVFGEIWTRPQLAPRDRSISTLSILISLGALEELPFYAEVGRRSGLTDEEILEICNHLTLYAGAPKAAQAMQVLRAR
ncbi:carboxymuconolactone decarboxylase family protein [uncultured Phenylobacterium sp.]|uniref:carboxymuconolactone decarboxylase family protein n=1 Tax=uncultured Phenylobacterium sp. TaxID=349273 RepID=UPI0025DE4985|nr:carboxymuconolactone decarboxylase family protein [uncultured Phenylobacterium sp.]